MRRLHAAQHDLAWLPQKYRVLRGAIIGSVWTLIGGGVAAAMWWGAHFVFFGKVFVVIGSGGYWLGDRVSKRIVSGRLEQLSRGHVDLARLSNADDGELVHLRGTVRAFGLVDSLLGGPRGVYRRISARFGELDVIEERAVDFQLVDAEGNAIGIEVEGARWLVHDAKRQPVDPTVLTPFEELLPVRRFMNDRRAAIAKGRHANRLAKLSATEAMIRPGDQIEVVGYKSRQVDPMMADRMHRETPMRATLRAGKELPLILSRVEVA